MVKWTFAIRYKPFKNILITTLLIDFVNELQMDRIDFKV